MSLPMGCNLSAARRKASTIFKLVDGCTVPKVMWSAFCLSRPDLVFVSAVSRYIPTTRGKIGSCFTTTLLHFCEAAGI
eukprot:4338956-Amphidinium_carterae.1